MQDYQNLDGDSGVAQYENGSDYITVRFNDGACYKYTYAKPGATHVEQMKQLAVAGRGLNEYINTHNDVTYGFESKW